MSETKLRQIKILIVDDDHDDALIVRDILSEGLGDIDLKVEFSFSYMEAIHTIAKDDYDICLFDYYLGDIDGLELLEAVRSRGYDMPIIFLTGDNNPRTALDAMSAGATDLFFKNELSVDVLCPSIIHAVEMNQTRKFEEEIRGPHRDSLEVPRQLSTDISSIICELSPEGETLFVNNASTKITGYKPYELVGKQWWDVFASSREDDIRMLRRTGFGSVRDNEVVLKTRDGRAKVLEWNISNNYSDDGSLESRICVGVDITDRVHLREELYSMSLFDEITGLRNQRGFYKLADEQLKLARYEERDIKIFFIKAFDINDLILSEVSNILKDTFRESDIMAYLGNGNIVVLAMGVKELKPLRDRLEHKLEGYKESSQSLDYSLGSITYYPSEQRTLETLVKEYFLTGSKIV